MESTNFDDEENYSGKDQGSFDDVIISVLHWPEFAEELKLQDFMATAGSNQNMLPGRTIGIFHNATELSKQITLKNAIGWLTLG